MSVFTLAISCLTMCDLPWLMDLTFQVPMQYYSLQHQTLLSPPDTSIAEHCFCFDSAASFLLKLLVITLCSCSVAYWIPFELGELIFQCHIYLPFQTIHGVFQARILEWVAFPSPVDHILSEHSTGMRPSWVTLHGMAYSFIELHKPLPHNKVVIHEGEK